MRALLLTIERGLLRAMLSGQSTNAWAAEATFETPDELAALIASLPGQTEFDRSVRRARVILLPPLVQRRTLRDLPPVPLRALRELIALQPHRFFRRNEKPLVTVARWLPHPRGAPRVAEALAIESPWLDAIGDGVRDAGLVLDRIAVEDTPLTLLPAGESARRERAKRRHLRWLGVACALCWVATVGTHVGRLLMADSRLASELKMLERPAAALRAARRELTSAADILTTVERTASARGNEAALVQRIVLALPDSAHLATIVIDSSGRGVLTGAAKEPSALLARLDRDERIPAARFEGEPIGGSSPRDWQRFTIVLGKGAR